MVSYPDGLSHWLVAASDKTGIPLEKFVVLLAVNIALFLLLCTLLVEKILRRGGAGEDKESAEGTLAELVENK